jgi:hypothetical protein
MTVNCTVTVLRLPAFVKARFSPPSVWNNGNQVFPSGPLAPNKPFFVWYNPARMHDNRAVAER